MSALLENVQEAAELREVAEHEFRVAVIRAVEEGRHSLREVGQAAGLSKQRVSQILRGERK